MGRFNSAVCRKCSAIAQLNNVYALSSYPDHSGSAVEIPCRVKFDGDEDYQWEIFTNPDPSGSLC